MVRILIIGSDKQLARFYYAAHLRCPSITHRQRRHCTASYIVDDDDYPTILQLADDLHIDCETVARENKYRRIKNIIQNNWAPGEKFKSQDVADLAGDSPQVLYQHLAKLRLHGYLQSHGKGKGHFYSRPLEAENYAQ